MTYISVLFFFFQAEDGIRDSSVTGVQTCALPIYSLFMRRGRVLLIAAVATSVIGVLSCGREPTDPARSDITGLWKSFDVDRYLHDMEMELHQVQPGIVIGKWRAIGKINVNCPPGT